MGKRGDPHDISVLRPHDLMYWFEGEIGRRLKFLSDTFFTILLRRLNTHFALAVNNFRLSHSKIKTIDSPLTTV